MLDADIAASSTIELGLALTMAAGLLALGGWTAILRHRQDQHGRRISAHGERLAILEHDKTARDAVEADRAGRTSSRPAAHPSDNVT
jgi:hypothetical protein